MLRSLGLRGFMYRKDSVWRATGQQIALLMPCSPENKMHGTQNRICQPVSLGGLVWENPQSDASHLPAFLARALSWDAARSQRESMHVWSYASRALTQGAARVRVLLGADLCLGPLALGQPGALVLVEDVGRLRLGRQPKLHVTGDK